MNSHYTSGSAIPVTILTGFLGAGKTTLLNHILTGDHGLRVAVLVNDFGAINVDAELVVGVEDDMISLANGCVCCQIRDDLVEAIDTLLARPEPVDYVLLESSGVADPAGIFVTFTDSKYRDRIRVDSITCVVDAEQILDADDAEPVAMLKLRQIGFADMLILNKVDLAGDARVAEVRAWIDSYLNRVRIVEASHCRVPLEILLAVGRFDATRPDLESKDAHDHQGQGKAASRHASDFARWSYRTSEPLSLDALREMVKRRLPRGVFRCKGIVHSTDAPDRRAILQVVGRRSDVTLDSPWATRTPSTRIVAIGIPGEIIPEELQSLFDGCIAGREQLDVGTANGIKSVRI